MAFDLRIKDAKTDTLIETNTDFLDVEVEILETKTVRGREKQVVVETRKFGYPVGTTEAEIEAELSKFLETYNADHEAALLDAERQAERAATDETITSLKGKTIEHGNSDSQ